MKKNMGKFDTAIRIIVAVIIAALYSTGIISGNAGMILLIIGGLLLFTSIINFCPLYSLLGINTCSVKKR